MKHDYKDASSVSVSTLPLTRGYQQELLDESLKRNIIIALDTGSGKTHIAVLRMKAEVLEREQKKLAWFVAPTVALVEQQREVISTYIPVSVGMVSGASEPDQWKDRSLWRQIIDTHRIMVTTPQVLLDALRHGYVSLGGDISLLVFDEVHHAGKNHPYNAIMKEFYFQLPPRGSAQATSRSARPMILGLTASPIFGGKVERAFQVIEQNLDAVIRSTRLNREELAQFVHRPIFKHIQYILPPYFYQNGENGSFPFTCRLPSHNFASLQAVVNQLDIEDDPFIKSLRKSVAGMSAGPQRHQTDQKLSKVLQKGDTLTHRGLKDFLTSTCAICIDLGPWAADWYVQKVLEQAQAANRPFKTVVRNWEPSERQYLLDILAKVDVIPVSYDPEDISQGVTNRVVALFQGLVNEKLDFESHREEFSGIVFVTRRDVCIALTEVVRHHPFTRDLFQTGCLLGTSADSRRTSFLDVTRNLVNQPQAEVLGDFKTGVKNLIISTSVAEEGIDVQACCSVIRWDPPQNMISWAQSRGRARRKRSSFIIMSVEGDIPSVHKWQELEAEMVSLYNDPIRNSQFSSDDDEDTSDTDFYLEFVVPETGAKLTLHSAIAHLNHFCAVLPTAGYGNCLPVYETDPPEFPDEWHLNSSPYSAPPSQPGPYGATVYLPRHLPQGLRVFTTERVHRRKVDAKMFVAFHAYKALYEFVEEQFLNKHLLPLSRIDPDEQALFDSGIQRKSGMSSVTKQIDPWARETSSLDWWAFELAIGDELPILLMFVQREMPDLRIEELPTLYIPGRGAVTVSIKPLGSVDTLKFSIDDAREFTRRLLWRIPGSRLKIDWDVSFEYLFYPRSKTVDSIWDVRWQWVCNGSGSAPEDSRLNAEYFGKSFDHPTDITFVRSSGRKREDFRFLAWKFEKVTFQEQEKIRERYARRGHRELEITYPLMLVKPIGRKDFLVPFPDDDSRKRFDSEPELLVASHSTVHVSSPHYAQYARLLPSILRHLSVTYTVHSFRNTILATTPLATLPFETLLTALSAPAAQMHTNYERMETLGDTVLKLMTSIQVMADHPFWHEGYLSMRKDHVVANVTLARCAMSKELYRWIIRDPFVPTRWLPQVETAEVTEVSEADEALGKEEKLSTKLLADVVEALIGAAYLYGDFEMGIECAKLFGMGVRWNSLPESLGIVVGKMEPLDDLPLQMIDHVEKMLDYEFTKKTLLVEALTHPSYSMHVRARPYDRLEFLGDAVLDMVVTDYLYRAPGKQYTPGHIYLRKVAIVNLHFLAFICLNCSLSLDASMPKRTDEGEIQAEVEDNKVYLWQCLLQSNAIIMEDMYLTSTRFKKVASRIQTELKEASIYPWAALTSLQAPKFFSDIVESLLGAIYLDTNGDLNAVRETLRVLGLIQVLERIVNVDIDVLHPVSRLAQWAGKSTPQKKIRYQFEVANGRICCRILMRDKNEIELVDQDQAMDEREDELLMSEVVQVEAPYRGQASRDEVKFSAAEEAIRVLHLREEENAQAQGLTNDT